MTLRLISKTYWRGTWIRFRAPEPEAVPEIVTVYAHDGAQVRGVYWTPRGRPRPRVAVIAAHPRVDFSQHYAFPDFLRAGSEFTATTLPRFYAIHMLLVPGLIIALIGAHLYLVVKLGTTAPPWLKGDRPKSLRKTEVG